MVDWTKVKTEYITTDISYRKLAQKHGISPTSVYARGGREGWVAEREQYRSKVEAKTLNVASASQASKAVRLQTVTDKLLAKVESILDGQTPARLDCQAMKHISGVLKDIKDIQMIRSEADMKEQEARIRKLEKEAQAEEKQNAATVTVVFEGADVEEWSG